MQPPPLYLSGAFITYHHDSHSSTLDAHVLVFRLEAYGTRGTR
jgi:hypothetical protein